MAKKAPPGWLSSFGKKRKNQIKKNRSLTESSPGANLPSKAETRELKAVERRLAALEKKNNPKYKAEYAPFYDPLEAKQEEVKSPYYQKISNRYRLLKWGAFFLFGVFFVFMIFTFGEEITVENFRYMMRSIDFETDAPSQLKNDIVYVADENNIFLGYREYLAMVNEKELTVYDTSGGVAHSQELSYAEPAMTASEKYLLVYDKSGTSYSVHSYFATEHSEELDYPVLKASVSNSGIYALATKSKDHVGAVFIYNGSFKLMNRILKNKYISAIDLTDSGDEIIICAYAVNEQGGIVSEITLLPTSANESRLVFTIDSAMVYECRYLENGGFLLVCSDGVRFYDSGGKEVSTLTYNGERVNKYITGRKGALLVLSREDSPDSIRVLCYGADASVKRSLTFEGNVIGVYRQGDYVYALYSDRLLRTSLETGEWQTHNVERGRVAIALAQWRDGVYVCTAGMAYLPEWKDADESALNK